MTLTSIHHQDSEEEYIPTNKYISREWIVAIECSCMNLSQVDSNVTIGKQVLVESEQYYTSSQFLNKVNSMAQRHH